jgi:hypothetical protein
MTTKVPSQCSLVLLVKGGWRSGETFRSEEDRDEKWRKGRK